MRVLVVNTYHYARGGAEVHALALASALADAGHDVRFFGMHDPRNEPSPDSSYWTPNIDYAELNRSKSPTAAFEVLRRSLYSSDAARRIGALVDDWRPDVAHVHNIHAHLTLSVVVQLHRRGIPVVWTLHDYKLICPNTSLAVRGDVCERCKGGRFMQCTLNRCKKDSMAASFVATLEAEVGKLVDPQKQVARFIAPSAFLMRKFGEFGWDTSKFVHIPNFAPADEVPVARAPVPGRFVYTGRLDRSKGVGTLLEAVGRAPDVSLDIAGEGPIGGEMRALAEAVAPGRVTFHGRVDAARLATLRDAARAVVVPSEWYENSPYAVLEAFTRGCPVVAADIGGLPELIQDGDNGLLFASGDSDDLVRALRRLVDEPGLSERLDEGALGAAQNYRIDEYVDRLMRVYGSSTHRE